MLKFYGLHIRLIFAVLFPYLYGLFRFVSI